MTTVHSQGSQVYNSLTICGVARDFAKKGGMMLRDALEMFEAGRQIADWSGG